MIAFVRALLTDKQPTRVVVEHNGLGLEMLIPLSTFAALPGVGAEVFLHTHLHVREDALTLVGFASAAEKELFELLLSVSGIGVRSALAILGGSPPAELYGWIARGDEAALTRIPGLGKKTAQRLILDLKEKAAQQLQSGGFAAPAAAAPPPEFAEQAVLALTGLGFSKPEAQRAIDKAAARLGAEAKLEELLRAALQG
ncbi:MAG TPA: Holliday junction branch migration protein RuvA [bacterium]|nr:Holliday junction branch migration protein RuvA [bacterium]HPR88485.1 Holliday junction branch migration protein RuvA [bacterium]